MKFWSAGEKILADDLNQNFKEIYWGTESEKPSNPTKGMAFYATDSKKLYLCTQDGKWTLIPVIEDPQQGDIIYYDGSNWVRLPAGDAGKVLKSQGAGANPIWSEGAPFKSRVLVYLSNDLEFGVNKHWRKIEFNQVVFDNDNEYDTTNHKFIANESGYYLVIASALIDTKYSDEVAAIEIRRNGSAIANNRVASGGGSNGVLICAEITKLIHLNANDELEVYGYNSTEGPEVYIKASSYQTYFCVLRVA